MPSHRPRCTWWKALKRRLAAAFPCCCPRRQRACSQIDQSAECYAMVQRMMSIPDAQTTMARPSQLSSTWSSPSARSWELTARASPPTRCVPAAACEAPLQR